MIDETLLARAVCEAWGHCVHFGVYANDLVGACCHCDELPRSEKKLDWMPVVKCNPRR